MRIVLASTALLVLTACAGLRSGPADGMALRQDLLSQVMAAAALRSAAQKAYDAHHFTEATALFLRTAAAGTGGNHAVDIYNAACSASLAGDTSEALTLLTRAAQAGYHDVRGVAADDDLVRLRSSARWPVALREVQEADTRFRQMHADPMAARIVSEDIARFWLAFDAASRLPDSAARVAAYRTLYFERGSPGLMRFFVARIGSVEAFEATVERHRHFYASLRSGTAVATNQEAQIRNTFVRLKTLYPDAIFPDVYFLVGPLTSGGTTTQDQLLIGTEFNAASPATPTDELSPNLQRVIKGPEHLFAIVAHELVHVQQHLTGGPPLLRRALEEGGADFVGELLSGVNMNDVAAAYGDAHELAVWQRFSADMSQDAIGRWFYNGASKDVGAEWPADMGYYVGYRIAKAYYRNATDKQQALRDLLTTSDPSALLRESRYDGRPHS